MLTDSLHRCQSILCPCNPEISWEICVVALTSVDRLKTKTMSDKLAESIEDDNSVTMLDVLQEENQLEEDAYAVLGASDDQNCTYNKVVL